MGKPDSLHLENLRLLDDLEEQEVEPSKEGTKHTKIISNNITRLLVAFLFVTGVLSIYFYLKHLGLRLFVPPQQPFQPIKERSGLKFVIPIDKIERRSCQTIFSALVNGYPAPHLLGLNRTYKSNWDKLSYLFEFSSTLPDDDLILSFDAYDVWAQLPLEIALARYKNVSKGLPKIMFGANKGCWPFKETSGFCNVTDIIEPEMQPDVNDWLYHKQTDNANDKSWQWHRAHHLNAGTFLGPAKSVSKFYKAAVQLAKQSPELMPNQRSDQGVLVQIQFAGNWRDLVHIDQRSLLWAVMYRRAHEYHWVINPDPRTLPTTASKSLDLDHKRVLDIEGLNLPNSVWRNRYLLWNSMTNAIPTALHLNHDVIDHRERWWKEIWFYKDGKDLHSYLIKAPSSAGAWVEGRWSSYADLCGAYDLF